jgi:hypothetical protein
MTIPSFDIHLNLRPQTITSKVYYLEDEGSRLSFFSCLVFDVIQQLKISDQH